MRDAYIYKLTVDDGGAPCITRELLSLAICKPAIRRTAKVGDIIFGFAANSLHSDNRLIYAAVVTEKAKDGTYYETGRFARRQDCIYGRAGDRLSWRPDARFHKPSINRAKDLGAHPSYRNAQVILSSDFRYFGSSESDQYKFDYPRLAQLVGSLGQGHRKKLGGDLKEELRAYEEQLWRSYPNKLIGRPFSRPNRTACHSVGRHCVSPCS